MTTTTTPPATTPSLRRDVGLWGAVGLGLGSILGTGVFVSIGIAAGVAGPYVVIAVALAALVAIANGLSSAQLAAAAPVSGGTYEYGYRYLHPAAGVTAGWFFLAAKSASAATAALGCTAYLLHTFGAPSDEPAWRIGGTLLLVVALTALVAGGVRRSNRANGWIVAITIASLAAFIGFGIATVAGRGEDAGARFGLAEIGSALGSSDGIAALLQATALMFVAYTGYGRVATLGEEVREPGRTIPRAVIATLLVSMALYLAVAATGVAVVGAAGFAQATIGGVAAPLEVIAGAFTVPEVGYVVAVGAITAMLGVLLNLLLGLSRVVLAMGRRADLPAPLATVQAATGSPTRAVWLVGVVIAGLVLIGDVRTTWSFSALTVLLYYGITNAAALRLPAEDRRYPRWIAWVGLVSCVGLAAFVDWWIAIPAAGVLVGGAVVSLASRRWGGRGGSGVR